jgi:hypothetical protein
MTAWLSDLQLWIAFLLAAGIYVCAKGLQRLSDTIEAFHEDYRKVNHLEEQEDS